MIPADPETARKLFAQNCDFMRAVAEPAHFPPGDLPEVALIGRSNVGKSSLINALTGRKALARASNTPGRTQQIVFFDLAHRLVLADLPGYGHAEAPREVQDRWTGLVNVYLRKRENLKAVCLLLDGRHGAKNNDIEMMKFLDRAALIYQVVLTKMDKLHARDYEDRIAQTKALLTKHPAALSDIIATSSESNLGIEKLREFIAGFAV